jgi:soluble lytic murein transglycosylase
LEQQKKYDEAVETYLSISDGRGEYYGWRATQRLKQLSVNEVAKPHIENKLAGLSNGLKAKNAELRTKAAQDILRLTDQSDTRELAMNVLKSSLRNRPAYKLPPVDVAPSVARSDAAKRLLDLGLTDEAQPDKAAYDLLRVETNWKKMPTTFALELMPREQLAVLYPAPFADELLSPATASGVDPRFVLAIMRQESRFQFDARSASAARGLMQFIHTTTARISNELGRAFFTDNEMYDPETSIMLGAHYLESLFAMFPERYEAVAAAYNGGEANVKRWLARVNSSEPERYMPEIVFGQSKDYAAKVMENYRMYKYLYDERLALRSEVRSE